MKIQSTPITFIDQTDSRKLEVYITSNMPTVQIFNGNSGAYTPDWTEGEKLVLSMDVFLDSRTMTTAEYNGTAIKWYKNDVEMTDGSIEDISDDKRKITIKDNILKDNAIITYTCEATYQGIVALARIIFTRVDTGLNGENGVDGTSVKILGTASSVAKVGSTNYYTITYSEGAVVAAELGDSYVYNGDLYVCSVLNGDGNDDYFVNVGPIQGEPGAPAKSIVLTGSSQVFKVAKDGTLYPSAITVAAHTVNLTNEQAQSIKWEYRYNASGVWTTISNGASTSDGVITLNNNVATINGGKLNTSTMSVVLRATFEDAEDVLTVYKTSDGVDGAKGDSAPIAFLTNENISFVAEADGVTPNMQVITTRVVAYEGAKKVKPQLGSLTITQAGLPTGMSITVDEAATNSADKEIVLTVSVQKGVNLGSSSSNNGSISIPVVYPVSAPLALNWTKINAGPEGANFRTFTTEYETSQTNIDNWSKMESIEWDVNESTYGTKVGDTVIIRCYNTTKQGYSYILATVISVPSGKKIHAKSTGLLDKGDPGIGASLVDVTPSAMYFKSTTGSTGPFDPQYIYLYPRFQNATYSNWQYSRDGGTTWASVAGANGLTIGTYNSVANSLRIDRASTLYTNTITSISFRCNSTNASVYDTVSIAKVYDVADLQIGGANLLRGTKDFTLDTTRVNGWRNLNDYTIVIDEDGFAVATKENTGSVNNVNYGMYSSVIKVTKGDKFTVSFWMKVKDISQWDGQFPLILELYNTSLVRIGYRDCKISELNIMPSTLQNDIWTYCTLNVDTNSTPFAFGTNTWDSVVYFGIRLNLTKNGHIYFKKAKLERGDKATDYTQAPEDLIEEAANVNVMLSNEAHFFEATAGGVPIDTSVTLDVVGYKGSVKSATTVGTISGIPSAGMTATVTNNGTVNTKLTITITSALTSDIADYGILTIPITVNGHTINKIFNWTKAKAGDVGASGSDAVTFQVYSNNGYALSTSVPTLTLQTFAYVGDVEIKAGATYQWYRHNNTSWVAVSGATNDYFNVSRDDVTFSNNYMCKMLFGGAEYVGVVTIEDKNDENKVFASKPYNYFAGDLWIVGTDYVPSGYTVGTMLRAEHTNTAYTDSDWVPATKYDDEINDLKDTVDSYKQYFSVNSTKGLQIGNSSINNDVLTTDTVNAASINAESALLESLDIVGRYSGSTMLQAPVINLGKFSIVIESNGSLSVVANT